MREIKRVAVLGSGVMGGAIAAHLANCGVPSLMLDIVPPNLSEEDKTNEDKRNAFALASLAGLLKFKPSPLFLKSNTQMIEVGNFDDDFERISECDWICEVVKEDLAIKKAVFEKVAKYRAPGSIVSTNTSGIPLAPMLAPMDEDMRRHFVGTHFFNPPRYMKLLEIIPTPETSPEVVRLMADFGENILGKGIVYAKDTPNFVANRILTFSIQYILHRLKELDLTVEDIDALTGPVIGHARSATFRTTDLVGLDTLVHVIGNVYNGCPDDEERDLFVPPDFVKEMLDKGYLGEKTGSGFFQKTDQRDEKGDRIILGLDPRTVEYRLPKKPRFDCIGAARHLHTVAEKIKVMHTSEDVGSKFVWDLFARTAIYAANRIPEIADDIVNIDNSVKWGFGWKVGIFETWDILGFDYVCERMAADGLTLPRIAEVMKANGAASFYKYDENGVRRYFDIDDAVYKPVPTNPNQILLSDIKKGFGVAAPVGLFDKGRCVLELENPGGKMSVEIAGLNLTLNKRNHAGVVNENEFASLIDMGDGICCVEFHSKMNTIERFLAEILVEGINRVNAGEFDGMIIANQEEHFCAGANLMVVLGMAMQNDWKGLTEYIDGFQHINMALRFCRGPVVTAPHNYCFGGGVEICQHSARVVIAGETYGGLVEFGVGLIPAGGGTKEMLRRALAYAPESITEATPYPYLRRAFEAIGMAKVSMSGAEMIELGYFTENDVICVNWDHQVKRAKDVCRALVLAGYRAPRPARLVALGEPMKSVFRAALYQMRLSGYVSEHDELVAMHLAHTLTGGNRSAGAIMTEQDVLDLEREAMLSLCGTEKTQQRMQHMLATGKPLRN